MGAIKEESVVARKVCCFRDRIVLIKLEDGIEFRICISSLELGEEGILKCEHSSWNWRLLASEAK